MIDTATAVSLLLKAVGDNMEQKLAVGLLEGRIEWLEEELGVAVAGRDSAFNDLAVAKAEVERLTVINERLAKALVTQGNQYAAEVERLTEAVKRLVGSLGVANSAGHDHPDIVFARAALAAGEEAT